MSPGKSASGCSQSITLSPAHIRAGHESHIYLKSISIISGANRNSSWRAQRRQVGLLHSNTRAYRGVRATARTRSHFLSGGARHDRSRQRSSGARPSRTRRDPPLLTSTSPVVSDLFWKLISYSVRPSTRARLSCFTRCRPPVDSHVTFLLLSLRTRPKLGRIKHAILLFS